MRTLICLLLLIASNLFSNASTTEELSSLHGDPSALVYGCVNAITGDLIIHQQDAIVKGAEPITIPRRYISREIENPALKWHLLNHGTAIVEVDLTVKAFVPEPSGITVSYLPKPGAITREKKGMLVPEPLELVPVKSQFEKGLVHSQGSTYHPMTNKVILEKDTLKVTHADGSYRLYKFFSYDNRSNATPLTTTSRMVLDHERLGNGSFLHYKWKSIEKSPVLISIRSTSAQNTLLAKVEISSSDKNTLQIKTSDSHCLKYTYKKGKLFKTSTPEYPKEKRFYDKKGRLTARNFPDHRRLTIKYKDNGKVTSLIGPEKELCSFKYKKGLTKVTDKDDNRTHYHYDPDTLRLSKIEYYQGKHILLKKETFEWDSLGNLIKKQIGGNHPLITLTYTYDENGLLLSKTEEDYTTHYSYNDRNLLLEEKEDSGLATTLTYLENTNLPTSKILTKDATILSRTLYEYNEDNILTKEILDDGPNFTLRKIKRIYPRKDAAFYGLPETIEELYQDGQEQKLLRRTKLTYDMYGNIAVKAIYDSEDNFSHKIETHYNKYGQLTKKVQPHGHVTEYEYDRSGNKTHEISPYGLKIHYEYDRLNRCIEKHDRYHTTRYLDFTFNGQPRQVEDSENGITKVEYDALGNLLCSTDHRGNTTTYTYDALGRQTFIKDPQNHITRTIYNIYGSPLAITHPDGNTEHYTYTSDGKKKSYMNQNGTLTTYNYDAYGNIIHEEISHEGKPLRETHKKYTAFHLIEETDPVGVITSYKYDPSGKLIEKNQHNLTTTYQYDTLGRLSQETSLDYTRCQSFDKLDRVITEKEYSNDKLLSQTDYTYELKPHKKTISNQLGETHIYYDDLSREIEKVDPLNQTTTISYYHDNQIIRKIIEESGDIDIIDSFCKEQNKTIIRKKKSNALISREVIYYDSCDNPILHKTKVFKDGGLLSTHRVDYTHDRKHRKRSETENGQKTTSYSYTPTGQTETLTKPDGTTLYYTYDPLGNLTTLRSSDGTIHYTYTYNERGELLSSFDHIDQTSTTRTLDPLGNILEERLGNSHTLHSTYDPLSRRTSLRLPNKQTINYTYEGYRLKDLSFDNYTHTYHYDLVGNPTKETTINNANIDKTYDKLSRPLNLTSPTFTQTNTYNSRGNITSINYNNKQQSYSYDPLDQLTEEPSHTYEYDSLHNRRSKDDLPYTINSFNQVEKADTAYTYDQNGSLTSRGETIFQYDALDRLIKVITLTTTHTYTYDSEHRRLTKNNENYIWDGNHELGTLSLYRILGPTPNAEIGAAIAIINNNTPYIPVHDLQGNLIQILDLENKPVEIRQFSAFGETQSELNNPWGFCSKRHDPETGLIYFGRRYYDPNLGRFITTDPEGYTDSYNLYAYTLNNPLTNYDPYGLELQEITQHYLRQTQNFMNTNYDLGLEFLTREFLGLSRLADYGYQALSTPFRDTSLSDRIASRNEFWDMAEQKSTSGLRSFFNVNTDARYFSFMDQQLNPSQNMAMLELPMPSGAARTVTRKLATQSVATTKSVTNIQRQLFQNKKAASIFKGKEIIPIQKGVRKRLIPNFEAKGPHTVFRRDLSTGRITHYETYVAQNNRYNPNPWKRVRRYDGVGKSHYDKTIRQKINAPHIHEYIPSDRVRYPELWEIPK